LDDRRPAPAPPAPDPPAGYAIRSITDPSTLRRCEALQAAVWGMGADEIVPLAQFVAAISAGGQVLGAFHEDGELVGFAYAFPGRRADGPLWYSHMLGVLPAHQGAGLGACLKWGQREAAIDAGVERIVWTYDPLQARNARFNFDRLGVVASRYYVDYYGPMTDAINRGLPSDRFEVDWWLRSPRVLARLSGDAPPAPRVEDLPWALAAAAPEGDAGAWAMEPTAPDLSRSEARLLVAIPPDLGRLKAERSGTALRWREATRGVFRHYFARGYAATAVIRAAGAPGPRIAYVVEAQGGTP
jgi:predicted GNAT superfamily acetyltransferase